MANQRNQDPQQEQRTPQQAPATRENQEQQGTQAGGGANGYDPDREQQEVNRQNKELDTEESNDSKNPNPSKQSPGRGL